jgi:predicted benzoate:H+ symporter BenE
VNNDLTLQQQRYIAELTTGIVYHFVGWIIGLFLVVFGFELSWMIWMPAGSMLLGVLIVRATYSLSGRQD